MVVAAFLGAAVSATAQAGAGAFLQRPRFPPVNVGQLLQEFQSVRERGSEPVLSRDPFTGEFIVSTASQFDAGVTDSILLDRFLSGFGTAPSGAASPRSFGVSSPGTGEAASSPVVAKVEATRVFSPRSFERLVGGRCAGATTAAERAICAAGGVI